MKVPFKILRITSEITEPIILNPAAPHRHDHEELLILTHGNPVHHVDYTEHHLQTPVIVYVAQGKIHSFIPDKETRGWVIRYKNELIPDSRFHFYSDFSDDINFPLGPEYCSTSLESLCELMLREYEQQQPNYKVISHLLSALLTRLEEESKKEFLETENSTSPRKQTFSSFLKILEYNYKRPESADFYADKLNMSTRNLNLITQSVFGKTVSELIETRKLIEARRLLLSSEKSVSEIGFELGYNEKSYFTRVFRKRTGKTPSEFRQQIPAIS